MPVKDDYRTIIREYRNCRVTLIAVRGILREWLISSMICALFDVDLLQHGILQALDLMLSRKARLKMLAYHFIVRISRYVKCKTACGSIGALARPSRIAGVFLSFPRRQ